MPTPQELLTKAGISAPVGSKEATDQILAKGASMINNPPAPAASVAPAATMAYPSASGNLQTSGSTPTPSASSIETTPFRMEAPLEFSSDLMNQAFMANYTSKDLQDLLNQNKSLMEERRKTYQMSEEESNLSKQLNAIRDQITGGKIEDITTAEGIKAEPISAGAMTGRYTSYKNETELKNMRLALEEQNLINRLGLAKEARVDLREGLTADMNTLFQVQNAISNERQQFFTMANTLSDNAYKNLSFMVNSLKGSDFTDMSMDQQMSLASVAKKAGIPIDVLKVGLKTAKDEVLYDRTTKQRQLDIQSSNSYWDNLYKQAQIERTKRETELLGEPTAKEKKEIDESLKNAKASIPVMQDKIDAVDALLENSGLNSRVGSNFISRKSSTANEGIIGGVKNLLSGAKNIITGSIVSDITGAGQSFAGGIHKLVSGLTLDSLIQAKAQGATFGALSDSELQILANSASAINDWELKDKNGRGLGIWNIDQNTFKKELENIQKFTRRAMMLTKGTVIDQQEQSLLDSLFDVNNQDPSNFYK